MNKYFKHIILQITLIYFSVYSTNIYSNTNNYKKIYEYLGQLEHVSNAHSQCLKHFQKQLLTIEQDIDYLRGRIQDNEYKLLKIMEQQKNIIEKIETIIIKHSIHKNDINNNVTLLSKNQSNIFNSSNQKNINHTNDYNKAVNLVLEKKQYEKAIQAFQEFILKYPNSTYQSNAHYWLGQLNYRKGNKHDASYHFALVAKNFPKSSKAPDALLKVGVIMQENGDHDKAKIIYKQINYLYPNSDAAKQIQKRLASY